MAFKPLKCFFLQRKRKRTKLCFPIKCIAEGPRAEKKIITRNNQKNPQCDDMQKDHGQNNNFTKNSYQKKKKSNDSSPSHETCGFKKESPVTIKQPFFDAEQKASWKLSASGQVSKKCPDFYLQGSSDHAV